MSYISTNYFFKWLYIYASNNAHTFQLNSIITIGIISYLILVLVESILREGGISDRIDMTAITDVDFFQHCFLLVLSRSRSYSDVCLKLSYCNAISFVGYRFQIKYLSHTWVLWNKFLSLLCFFINF